MQPVAGERDCRRDPHPPNAAAGGERSRVQLRQVLGKLHKSAVCHHGLTCTHRRLRSETEAWRRSGRRWRREEDRQEGEVGGPVERASRDAKSLHNVVLSQSLHTEVGSRHTISGVKACQNMSS